MKGLTTIARVFKQKHQLETPGLAENTCLHKERKVIQVVIEVIIRRTLN